jgi:cyclic-di-AMP phosphodiesterase PgpH
MSFLGQKRHRPTRTLSVRGPETLFSRIAGVLRDRAIMGRGALCLLAILMMLIAVQSWRVPFPYREGQRMANGVVARINFRIINASETDRLRSNAEERAPFVFRNDPTMLEGLPESLRAALVAIEPAENIDQLDQTLRESFGLTSDSSGAGTPQERFALLKAAVTQKGQQTASQRIESIVVDFDNFLQPMRKNGIISPEDIRKQQIRLDTSRIQTVPVAADAERGEAGGGSDTRQTDAAPQLLRLTEVSLQDMLSAAGLMGDEYWPQFPYLQPIRPLITQWLQLQSPYTLRFDSLATAQAKESARESVPPVYDTVNRGDLIVPPDEVVEQKHLSLLRAEYAKLHEDMGWTGLLLRMAVVFLMLLVLAALNAYYIWRNEPSLIHSLGKLVVYLSWLVVAVALGVLLSNPWQAEVIALVVTVMVFAVAYNPVFATLTGFTLSLILTLATTSQLQQFIVLMSTAAAAALPLAHVSSRTTLIRSGLLAGLAFFLVSIGLRALEAPSLWQLFTDGATLAQSLKGAVLCVLAGYFIWGSLPVVESTFGVITDISLLEMSDPSHPLLQELVRRAPGTYNHSISVASIAESAAEAIGANGLLVRVGAYFHDIGKMLKPQYFIENVQAGGESRHAHLAPAMSTLIIIGHVKDGVDLAEQYNLPQQLIDFIEQHHGTTLVEYFYHEATRQAEESPDRRSDAEEASFRYPGPKPQTKEAGVLMLADACESASRALTDPTAKRLETLVHDMLMKRLLDNQFSECHLTLAELRIIEKSLAKSLIGIYHGRIKYPEGRTA